MNTTNLSLVLLALCASLMVPPACGQGSLNPLNPPGATMKSLDQIEPRTPIGSAPFTITASGSYYLTTNLICMTPGTNGITVMANDVTLDLSGFSIVNQAVGANGSGIYQSTRFRGLCVRNGMLAGWVDSGEAGLRAQGGGVRAECIQARHNFFGFLLGERAQIEGCAAHDNLNFGFDLQHGGLVRASTAAGNALNGIVVGNGSLIENAVSVDNGHDGIMAAIGCLVRGCTVQSNAFDGVFALTGCQISDCISESNGEDGIEVDSDCAVRHCTIRSNGRTGINAMSTRNTLDGNTVTINGTGSGYAGSGAGILVGGINNLVIRNWLSANQVVDFNVAAGNQVGTVMPPPSVVPPLSPAVYGNFSAGFGATDPFANITY